MNMRRLPIWREAASGTLICLVLFAVVFSLSAADTNDFAAQLRRLEEQNRQLQQQLREQGEDVKRLNARVRELEVGRNVPATENIKAESAPTSDRGTQSGILTRNISSENIIISGEGGIGLFHQGSQGQFRNAEFRVDEAKLFLDAKVWEDVYLFAEGNLFFREQYEDHPEVGELYVDFENVSKLWGQESLLNARLGRIDIPFGEEYVVRDAIDNPLISHSLSDIWGVDEGIEFYGRWKAAQYIFAVQNGGHPMLRDGDADKAIIGKVRFTRRPWLLLSVSGMRTGNLDVEKDQLSELWFGNGFFRALGSPATTTKFHANLLEGDIQSSWRRTSFKGAGGVVFFDDNDRTSNNDRDVYYYYFEAVHNLTAKWYAAVRWSQIFAAEGFPLVGAGNFATRLYGTPTEGLQRLSLGTGYRWSRDIVGKLEYSLNRGREVGGTRRDHEDFFGAEVSVRF